MPGIWNGEQTPPRGGQGTVKPSRCSAAAPIIEMLPLSHMEGCKEGSFGESRFREACYD